MKFIVVALSLFATSVFAQPTYHMVPSGDPANPYRIEAIAPPPPPSDVATFEDAMIFLRSAEGLDPTGSYTIMENPTAPAPACLAWRR